MDLSCNEYGLHRLLKSIFHVLHLLFLHHYYLLHQSLLQPHPSPRFHLHFPHLHNRVNFGRHVLRVPNHLTFLYLLVHDLTYHLAFASMKQYHHALNLNCHLVTLELHMLITVVLVLQQLVHLLQDLTLNPFLHFLIKPLFHRLVPHSL